MIALYPKEYSSSFYPIVHENLWDYSLEFYLAGARVASTQLLDGGTYHHDGGYSGKDRTGAITYKGLTRAQQWMIEAWQRARTALRLCCEEGVFDITLTRVTGKWGNIVINFRVDTVAAITATNLIYPAAPGPTWVDKTSDTYWTGGSYATWDGSQWENNYDGGEGEWLQFRLDATGGWEVDYRPTKIRVTFSGSASARLRVGEDWFGGYVVDENPYTSGDEITIAWAEPGNIYRILLTDAPEVSKIITKIEFYEE